MSVRVGINGFGRIGRDYLRCVLVEANRLGPVIAPEMRRFSAGPATPSEQTGLVLTDDEIREIAGWSVIADRLFKHPMELEWAKDGCSGDLSVVEVRRRAIPEVTIDAPDYSGAWARVT